MHADCAYMPLDNNGMLAVTTIDSLCGNDQTSADQSGQMFIALSALFFRVWDAVVPPRTDAGGRSWASWRGELPLRHATPSRFVSVPGVFGAHCRRDCQICVYDIVRITELSCLQLDARQAGGGEPGCLFLHMPDSAQ